MTAQTPAELQSAARRARVNTLSRFRHALYRVDNLDRPGKSGGDAEADDRRRVDDLDDANVITSEVANLPDTHTLVLDIDHPAALVESSTPGHFHLFIDHPMTWRKYRELLGHLADAGVIEHGYAGASIARGRSAVRLPWITKPARDDLDERLVCVGCNRHPSELRDCDTYAETEGVTNAEYVEREEGTLNPRNGHFRCDACYIAAGQPLGVTP